MKSIINIAVLVLLSNFINYAQSDSLKSINFSLDIGVSKSFEYDNSFLIPTGINNIDRSFVFGFGVNCSILFYKKWKVHPLLSLGLHSYQVKVSNLETPNYNVSSYKNVFGSLTMVAGIRFQPIHNGLVTLGVFSDKQFLLLPYATLLNNEKLGPRNYGYIESDLSSTIEHRGKVFNNGPYNIGVTTGVDIPFHRFTFGLHYYQRLYFTGFNREIARVMLRVGF